jgi:hypothetical protein
MEQGTYLSSNKKPTEGTSEKMNKIKIPQEKNVKLFINIKLRL